MCRQADVHVFHIRLIHGAVTAETITTLTMSYIGFQLPFTHSYRSGLSLQSAKEELTQSHYIAWTRAMKV